MKRSNIIKYFYEIFMAILAITNTIFLIYNLNRWEVNMEPTSILLTFIGFFFAFGGMYVYSIFNANVDAEKKAINELHKRYVSELNQSNQDILSVRNLLSFYQIGQLIANAPKISTQHFAWIQQLKSLHEEQKKYLKELSLNGSPLYRTYKIDFDAVCRGIGDLLQFMVKRVESEKEAFFADSGLSNMSQDKFLKDLKGLIVDLLYEDDTIEVHNELTDQDSLEKTPISERFKKALRILMNDTKN